MMQHDRSRRLEGSRGRGGARARGWWSGGWGTAGECASGREGVCKVRAARRRFEWMYVASRFNNAFRCGRGS